MCIQMPPGLEKLYYLKNKSHSRVVVEVDLTDSNFSKRLIEFKFGEIRQFLVLSQNVYTINCKGVIQIFNFKDQEFKEATVSTPGKLALTRYGGRRQLRHQP